MKCLISIDTDILEIYKYKWDNSPALSYKKFADEVIKCVILTDIKRFHSYGYNVYSLEFSKYSFIIEILRPDVNAYSIYNRIMHDLEQEEYFYCIEKGYHRSKEDWRPSAYCTTETFIKTLDKISSKKLKYIQFDIKLLHDRKIGIEKAPIYKYNGKEYEKFNDFVNKEYDFKGKSIVEIQKIRKEIKQNSIEVRTITRTGLDFCIISESNAKKELRKNSDSNHNCEINIDKTRMVANLDYMKSDRKLRANILIARNLVLGMEDDGYIMNYHHTKHGRLYQSGYNLQMMSKELRKEILDKYRSIDVKAAYYSLMYNYAIVNEYPGELPYLKRIYNDPDGYRNAIYEELKTFDPKVTYDYVKTSLTAMGYGARCSEKQIKTAIDNNIKVALVNTEGYENKYTPEKLVSIQDFKGLHEDIVKVKKFMVKKVRESGKKQLTNKAGSVINVSSKPKEITTSIYQGMEVEVLFAMIDYFKEQNLVDPVGLMVHDEVYIKKNYMEGVTEKSIQNFVFKKTGYMLKFTIGD